MKILLSISLSALMLAAGNLKAASYCGDIKNAFGPFDYRTVNPSDLSLVESGHFSPEVEKLIAGKSGAIGADIDYTLRAIPNHPRALVSLAKLALRDKNKRPNGLNWSPECYFNRAIRFRPDDGKVRMIYGTYLFKLARIDEALEQLTTAVNLDPENGMANYNLGLVYFHKQDYEKARIFAKKAEELEVPLPGLKNKLIAVKKWEGTSIQQP